MAREYFYYGSIKKSIIKFLNIFDDIKIAKYNSKGNIEKYVEVPVKFMPKQKGWIGLNQRKHEKRYPMIGVELTSIEYDNVRTSGQQEKIKISETEDSSTFTNMPVPYNLGFTVSISTEYQNEQDQINEQLLPFFNPYIMTKMNIAELGLKWDMKINFNGANIDTEIDIAEDDYRNVVGSHDYSVKTYLTKPSFDIGKVKKIMHNFFLNDTAGDNRNFETDSPSATSPWQEQLMIIGSKEDDEILAKYLVFGDES